MDTSVQTKREKEPERILSKAIFRHNYLNHLPLETVLDLCSTVKNPNESKLDKNVDYYMCYRRRKGAQEDYHYFEIKATALKYFGDDSQPEDQKFVVIEVDPATKDEFAQSANFTTNLYGIAWYIRTEPKNN